MLLIFALHGSRAFAQGTAFSYQGRLNDGISPATGSYDLTFSLYRSANGSSDMAAAPLTNSATPITNGLFAVRLDFGLGVFNGSNCWLEIAVRTNGGGNFVTLQPRQPVLPAPYAIMANDASNLLGKLPAAQLSGTISNSSLPANAVFSGAVSAGSFSGNGSPLANLNASQLSSGTVPDARLSTTYTNGLATTQYVAAANLQLANAVASPFVVMHTNLTFTFNSQIISVPGSQTAGIQEAINLLGIAADRTKPGGGTIYFDPGVYYTFTSISSLYSSNLAYSLTFQGCGISACGITYVGGAARSVMTVGNPGTRNAVIFKMRDMWMASAANGLTNILFLNGSASTTGGEDGGGIAKATIENCWFGYWNSMTNNNPFTPSCGLDAFGTRHNLIGIQVECNYNDLISIDDCAFSYCCSGISLAGDHCRIAGNVFETCGNQQASGANDWPGNIVYSAGPSIVFKEPKDGCWVSNGNKNWDIRANSFINCPLHYASILWTGCNPITIGSGPGKWSLINTVKIHEDGDESGQVMAITSGNSLVFINSKSPQTGPAYQSALPAYQMTSPNSFTISSMTSAPPSTVYTVDFVMQTNNGGYGFGGVVTAPYFSGSASKLTGLASSNIDGTLPGTKGIIFPQTTNAAPTALQIGGVVGSKTNHLVQSINGALIDFWSDGATVWSRQIAP